jgi:hypothetical protein
VEDRCHGFAAEPVSWLPSGFVVLGTSRFADARQGQ